MNVDAISPSSVDGALSVVHCLETGEYAQESRFTATVGPHDRDPFARRDDQLRDRTNRPAVLRHLQVIDLNHLGFFEPGTSARLSGTGTALLPRHSCRSSRPR